MRVKMKSLRQTKRKEDTGFGEEMMDGDRKE